MTARSCWARLATGTVAAAIAYVAVVLVLAQAPSHAKGGGDDVDASAAARPDKDQKLPGSVSGPAPDSAPDLERLRAEYDRLREALFKARVRSQNVAETVYATRFDVRLRWKGGPDFAIRKARFLLDGAEIWDSGDTRGTEDLIEIASRPIKPGPHALSVSLEIRPRVEAKGGAKTGAHKLGYTSNHVFAIVAPDSGQMHLGLVGDEDGDPPEYEPELNLEVTTEK